jgi:hypothetical protein
MAGVPFTVLGKRLLTDEQGLLAELVHPVLLWERPAVSGVVNPDDRTQVNAGTGGTADVPMVFELKKSGQGANSFPLGLAVGRVLSNDIAIEDASVSRFHAYFQHDAKTGRWSLADAGSRYGTWIASKQLAANEPSPVKDQDFIRFGAVELLFLTPKSLIALMRSKLGSGGQPGRSNL